MEYMPIVGEPNEEVYDRCVEYLKKLEEFLSAQKERVVFYIVTHGLCVQYFHSIFTHTGHRGEPWDRLFRTFDALVVPNYETGKDIQNVEIVSAPKTLASTE